MAGPDPIRVLVVDDSVVVRLLLGELIAEQEDMTLVGSAPNGMVGLEKIAALTPDVVVLDVEMPGLSGLEVLASLKSQGRRVPIVMCSTLTARGASATVDALTLGASDYVTKPSSGSREESLATLRDQLVPKLRALGRRRSTAPAPRAGAPRQPARLRPVTKPRVVVIGVSTGGPNALADVVADLPADLAVPVLIVQHMPPVFTTMLAKRLDACGPLTVREAEGGEAPQAGEVWLAPGGHHMKVTGNAASWKLALDDGPQEHSCRPAVDVLFRSTVAVHGAATLGAVLTGMGRDGYAGAQLIRDAGGQVLAQDEASCVVYGMPRFVVEGGLADAVLPLDQVAKEIATRVSPAVPNLLRA